MLTTNHPQSYPQASLLDPNYGMPLKNSQLLVAIGAISALKR
jgi:hypothetical protein